MPPVSDAGEPGQPAFDEESRQEVARLISTAFAQAREAGKENWTRMQAGVLKNRLLLLTDGEFDERQWGAKSFTSFLKLFPDLLHVDHDLRPPIVEWHETVAERPRPTPPPEPTTTTAPPESVPDGPRNWRIREDLWLAVMDVHRRGEYIWDSGEAKLVPSAIDGGPEAGREDEGPSELVLPTLTPEELGIWRREFAEGQTRINSGLSAILQRWLDLETPTTALPRQVRTAWFGELKRRVLARLDMWFSANSIRPPDDLRGVPVSRRQVRASDPPATDELRTMIVRCVEAMTRDELESLKLPATAVLRAQR